MQNVSSSNRSGYDALRKIYKESAEGEERLQVLGVQPFDHVKLTKLAHVFGCSKSISYCLKAYYLLAGIRVSSLNH